MAIERENFTSVLRTARERSGVTVNDLAQATNVAPELWRDLERSDMAYWPDHLLTPDYIRQYAEAVGLDPDLILHQFSRLFPEKLDRVEPLLQANPGLVHELG